MEAELRTMPLVSVIMPCYNVELFIEKAIKSTFNQTYSNLELICVNDGSTDNTADIIKKIKSQYNIKYIEQENKGALEARRTAVLHAKGEYIALVDADDSIEESAITKSMKYMLTDKCEAATWEFYSTDGVCSTPLLVYDKEEIISGIEALKQTLGGWSITGIGLFKKAIFEQGYILYDQEDFCSYNSDEYLTRAVFSKCNNVAKVKAQYFYYKNENSSSRKFKLDWLGRLDTDEAIMKLLKMTGVYNELKVPFINQFTSNLIGLKNGYKSNYKAMRQDERDLYLKQCRLAIKKLAFYDYISWLLTPGRPIKYKVHFLLTILFLYNNT